MKKFTSIFLAVLLVFNMMTAMTVFAGIGEEAVSNVKNGINNRENSNDDNNGNGEDKKEDSWVLTWNDEFDGPTVDMTKWQYDIGNWLLDNDGNPIDPGWGNQEKQFYTDDASNSYIEDGKLVIKAVEETTTDDLGTYDYTSAKLTSKGLFDQLYGKYEIRAKLPVGQGYWPAFWMRPSDDVYGTWAASGEIDIMEAWGSKPNMMSGAIHYGGMWPDNTHSGGNMVLADEGRIDEFHVYAIEWKPDSITWLVDDVPYHTETSWYSEDGNGETFSYPAPFDQEFYLIMNLAVGGWFDGDPGSDTVFPQTMEVDYVRVYELEGGYDEVTSESAVSVEPLPDGAKEVDAEGNYLSNGDFSEPIQDNQDGSLVFGDLWNYVQIADFGGNGSQTIDDVDGSNFARIDITSGGSKDYAVQLIQETTLGKGRYYKLSFDAKASADRTIHVKLGGNASRGFAAYSDIFEYELTDTVQHYERTFLMKNDSDIQARCEFNLGLDTNSVWIGNVKLVEVEAPEIDYDSTKEPLVDGNGIYNGAFDKESIDRMAYWNFDNTGSNAKAYVLEATRELTVDIKHGGNEPEDITVDQKGIQLEAGYEYGLSFDARTETTRDIIVKVVNYDGSEVYYEETVSLTADMTTTELSITAPEVQDYNAQLVYELGNDDGDVWLDNVILKAITVDYSDIDTYPIDNGDFALGLDSWGNYVDWSAVASVTSENEEAKIAVTSVGPQTWGIQLFQGAFDISNKVDYVLSFDVKSSVDRNLEVLLDNASYYRYFSETVSATSDYTHYEFTFKPEADDTVSLKFLMGKTDINVPESAHDIVIDNVDLHVVGAPEPPAEPGDGDDGGDSGDDGSEDGPIITNGTFDTDKTGWGEYMNDGSNASISVVDGELEVLFPAYAGWFMWSTQLFQEGISLTSGTTYTLSFDASATADRDIWLEMTDMDNQTIALTSTPQTFTYEFTATADTTTGKLNFLLGTENMNGEDFPAGSSVILDNVSIEVVAP